MLSQHILFSFQFSFEKDLVQHGKALPLKPDLLVNTLPELAAPIRRCPSHSLVLNLDEVVHQFKDPQDAER